MRWLVLTVLAVAACTPRPARNTPGSAPQPEASSTPSSDSAWAVPKDAHPGVVAAADGCAKQKASDCLALGVAFSDGKGGLTADESRAADLYERACDLGDIRGCNNLAVAFEKGQGRPADPKRAAELFEKNCRAEHALACRNLGRSYRDGLGVAADPAKASAAFASAKKLSERACQSGVAEGCSNLGFMYRGGDEGLPKNEAKAVEYLQRACDMGYRAVCGRVHEKK